MAQAKQALGSAALCAQRRWRRFLSQWQLWALLAVPVLYILIFHYYPMYGLQIAFKDFSGAKGIAASDWAGFKHFARFFGIPSFWPLIANTLILSLYSLVAGFPLPIILALALNASRRRRFNRAVQMSTYIPYFISVVVLVGMLSQFFSPKYGIVNNILHFFGVEPILFMGESGYFRHMFVWSGIWQATGWSSIIYMSALSTVDPELHQAALIDGATRLQRVRHVELPAIAPTIVVLLILSSGSILGVGFEKILLMQNVTNLKVSQVLSSYVYTVAFGGQLPNYSYATAIGLFNSVVNFIVIVLVNAVAKRYGENNLW
jgi:ABC-type polysaccharide transport system permease subunit